MNDKVNLAYGIDNFKYHMRVFAFYDINGDLIQYGSARTVSDDGSNPVVNTNQY
ncbi:MAG: hypothetical protein M3R25_00650 [Bacteroidota bacterium]|nr:hypothetical protein [Bacteroidota bacterium]